MRVATRWRYVGLGLLLAAALGYSAVGGSLRHMLSENRGHLAQLRLQFAADTKQQLAYRGEATKRLKLPSDQGDWADVYTHIQLALSPISSCPALAEGAPTRYSLGDDQARELARWIEGNSIIPTCLARKDFNSAAAYYAWAEGSVPGISGRYDRLSTQMVSAFAGRAFRGYEQGDVKSSDADWLAARSYLAGASYERFGDAVEKVAASHRKSQQFFVGEDAQNNPSVPIIRLYLAQAYNATFQGREALDAITPLLRTTPDDTRIWQQYGQALVSLNRIPEAQDAFQKAVRLGPDDLQAANRLGVLYQATGQTERAESLFRQALGLQDGAVAYWIWEHLGDALAKEGKRPQAKEAYRTAIAKAPPELAVSARKKLDELGN